MRRLICVALLVLAACRPEVAPAEGPVEELNEAFAFGSLDIVVANGERHEFGVYLAEDFDQQRRGLMFVRSMPEQVGMLFIYEGEEIRSMWMKNTYIPLDLVFARADGSITSVIHNAEPLTLNSRASTEPVRYVLELNGGVARRLGIGAGSRLEWEGK